MATVREIVEVLGEVDSIHVYFMNEEYELMNENTDRPKTGLLNMLGDYLVDEFWGLKDKESIRSKSYVIVVKEERRPLKREDVRPDVATIHALECQK